VGNKDFISQRCKIHESHSTNIHCDVESSVGPLGVSTYLSSFFFEQGKASETPNLYSAHMQFTARITTPWNCICWTTERIGHETFLWAGLKQLKIGIDTSCLIAWWAESWATPFKSLLMWYTDAPRDCVKLMYPAMWFLISQGTWECETERTAMCKGRIIC
jgi:hypothetical protein